MKGNTHMDHRKARKIYWLFLLADSIVIVLTAFATDEILQKIIIGAGVGVWIIGFIVAFCFIRCPYCRGALNLRGLSPDYCLHCGKKI